MTDTSDGDPSAFVLSAVIFKPRLFSRDEGPGLRGHTTRACTGSGIRLGPQGEMWVWGDGRGGEGGRDDIRLGDTACLSPSVSQLLRLPLPELLPPRRLVSWRPCAKSLHNPNPPASCRRKKHLKLPRSRRSSPGTCRYRRRQAALVRQGRNFNPLFVFCFATASCQRRRGWDHICAVSFGTYERVNKGRGKVNCAIICAAIFKRFNVVSSAYSALRRCRSRSYRDGNLCSTRIR